MFSLLKYATPKVFLDVSAWSLLFANLYTVYLATVNDWDFVLILLVYFCQSLIIGFFSLIKIITQRRLILNNKKIFNKYSKTDRSFIDLSFINFTIIYIVINLFFLYLCVKMYAQFNGIERIAVSSEEIKSILYVSLVFFVNHLFSFLYNRKKDKVRQEFFLLYSFAFARVAPMHLFLFPIIFFSHIATPIFLLLKTFIDVYMHMFEHELFGSSRDRILSKKGHKQAIDYFLGKRQDK